MRIGEYLLLLIQIIIMSILFIGQRNPLYYSPQLSNNKEIPQQSREKKLRQEQYRLDLLQQIRDKNERKQRQKEMEAKYVRRQQAILRRQLPEVSRIIQPPEKDNYHFSLKVPYSSFDAYTYQSPQSNKSNQNIFSPISYNFSHLKKRIRDSRIKTEGFMENRAFQEFQDSYEKRMQQLRSYEDKKFNEVYDKMYSSVEAVAQDDDYTEVLRSRMKPLRIKLPKKRYRRELPSRDNQLNPESKFYKLPPIIKHNDKHSEEESNWREWYAKEKLKELENYYKKVLIEDQIRENNQRPSRTHTPSFKRNS